MYHAYCWLLRRAPCDAWLRPWQVHDLECQIPLEARPVMQSAGPKKYNRVHGIGIDGVTIQVNPRTAPRAPQYARFSLNKQHLSPRLLCSSHSMALGAA